MLLFILACSGGNDSWDTVAPIFAARCVGCHAEKPTVQGFIGPPKGLVLDAKRPATAAAALIARQLETEMMPPGNVTGMTEEEREKVIQWAGGD